MTASPLSASLAATNPVEAAAYYVNPAWQREIDEVLHDVDDSLAHTLRLMRNTPSAYWIDRKAKIRGDTAAQDTLEGILHDAAQRSPPPLAAVRRSSNTSSSQTANPLTTSDSAIVCAVHPIQPAQPGLRRAGLAGRDLL